MALTGNACICFFDTVLIASAQVTKAHLFAGILGSHQHVVHFTFHVMLTAECSDMDFIINPLLESQRDTTAIYKSLTGNLVFLSIVMLKYLVPTIT